MTQSASPSLLLGQAGTTRRPWYAPPVWWAAFGAACILFQAVAWARWAAAGNLHGYPFTGYMPGYLKVSTQVAQAVAIAGCVVMVAVCWRGCRAAGRVTLSAALLAGYFLSFWSDPYSGTFHQTASNNLAGITYPTWGPYLPGWHGPTPQAQSLTENLGYVWVMVWIWIGLGIAALLRSRRPRWSRARVAWLTAVAVFVIDIALEEAFMRAGGYGYARDLPYLTLFGGQWYQLPLYSPAVMTAFPVMPIVLMTLYARPGREIWLLDGSLSLPRRAQAPIRLLAGIGMANLAMLALQAVVLLGGAASHPIHLPPWYGPPA